MKLAKFNHFNWSDKARSKLYLIGVIFWGTVLGLDICNNFVIPKNMSVGDVHSYEWAWMIASLFFLSYNGLMFVTFPKLSKAKLPE